MGIRLLCLLSLVGTAFSAHGAFQVCNRSSQVINLARAFHYVMATSRERFYHARGWLVIPKNTCVTVEKHGNREMWFRGMGEEHSYWNAGDAGSATRKFCIRETEIYNFDERHYPGIHSSETACAAQGGVLKQHFLAYGTTSNYFVDLEDGEPQTIRPKEPIPKPPVDREPIPPELSGPKQTTFGPGTSEE